MTGWILYSLLMLLAASAVLSLILMRTRGVMRTAILGLIALALLNPVVEHVQREPLKDIVVVLSDESGSQTLDNRLIQTRTARDDLMRQLAQWPDIEIRERTFSPSPHAEGTALISAMQQTLNDLPVERLAGVLMITDGIIHDVPVANAFTPLKAPLHVLLTGKSNEKDRLLRVLEAPRFGLVGKESSIRVRLDETGGNGQNAELTIRVDGIIKRRARLQAGVPITLNVTLEHAGANIVELDLSPLEGELTLLNNKAVVSIEGVRDKLKVLLVSGEPHAGERTWRNLLKSDPNVDLVHFTILRPPEKQDNIPINELALIAFPTRELFQVKINEFDLIILDRYANQSILPIPYYENIARFVMEGGALLVASGPEFAGSSSLATTPLVHVLPASANGQVFEQAFKPRITTLGTRHPVTRDLIPDAHMSSPQWGEWGRILGTSRVRGMTIMSDGQERPLLVLAHEGKGRVGLLLSDHAWLWARGFQEGGPHADLLRRLSHWLMKEPDLYEEALRATSRDGQIIVTRQSMGERVSPARVTFPDGSERTVTLEPARAGLWQTTFDAPQTGLVKITQDQLNALVGVGTLNAREYQDVIRTDRLLRPLVELTGGTIRPLSERGDDLSLPRLVRGDVSTSDTIALRPLSSSRITGVSLIPLIMGLIGFLTLIVPLIGMWLYEGRSTRQSQRG